MQADLAHLFAKPWHLAIGNRQRCIWSNIPARRTRSAGGEHQMAAHLIHQLAQRLFNDRLLVWD
ncbi:hypothetical protein D3C80_1598170 [compost metagenome]